MANILPCPVCAQRIPRRALSAHYAHELAQLSETLAVTKRGAAVHARRRLQASASVLRSSLSVSVLQRVRRSRLQRVASTSDMQIQSGAVELVGILYH